MLDKRLWARRQSGLIQMSYIPISLCKNFGLSVLFFIFISTVYAQKNEHDPVIGTWKTIDEEINEPTSLVQITASDSELRGTVIRLLPVTRGENITHCTLCTDERRNQPIVGMVIMKGLKRDKPGHWSGGEILDPEEGKVYKVRITTEDGKTLTVRGYIGLPLLGRTQIWQRAD